MSGKVIFIWAALNGGLAAILAAMGAHQPTLAQYPELRTVLASANSFHFYHTLGLLFVGLWWRQSPGVWKVVAAVLWSLGIILFCSTLYYYVFTGEKLLGFLTPIGGALLILGWLAVAIAAWQDCDQGRH